MEIDLAAVEGGCDSLVRRHLFLEPDGEWSGPERQQTARYRFLHSLYRHVVNARAPTGHLRQWHQRIGEWKEAAYAGRATETALKLAMHFERGGDS